MESIDVNSARERLKGIIHETQLIKSRFFSQEYKNEVYIKPENLQKTGAFKIRGAYNKIAQLSQEEKAKGLVASSAGNHAQGVAYAANLLGVESTIVMPTNTPLIKVEATRDYGARVILHGGVYDEAYDKAMALQNKHGYTFIHPFDDPQVIAGQGTIGLEILDQCPQVDYVLVPIGGGGLISGIAKAIKARQPDVQVIGVEPRGAQTLKKALKKDHLISLKRINTIAEGAAVKRAGNLTFTCVRDYVDRILTVTDVDIMEAFLLLLENEKIVAENAGVLALAAIRKLHVKDKKIVSVISGGNIDVVTMSEHINRGLVVRGRVFCFAVELPDTPGQLEKISHILSQCQANIIKLDHNQFKTIDRFKRVHLEVTIETNGPGHIKAIKEALNKEGYAIEIVYG